jgi:hypothetical protein
MQSLQDPNHISEYNLDNVICVASKHFRHEKQEYMMAIINELAIHSKNKSIETYAQEYINLRRATSLKVTLLRMRMAICSQIPTAF